MIRQRHIAVRGNEFFDHLQNPFFIDAVGSENTGRHRGILSSEAQQNVFCADIFMMQLLRGLNGQLQRLLCLHSKLIHACSVLSPSVLEVFNVQIILHR